MITIKKVQQTMNMQTEMVSHFFMKVGFGPFYQLVCHHQLLSQ